MADKHRYWMLGGTNLSNKKDNLVVAAALMASEGIEIIKNSNIYSSQPWGMESENTFWNIAWEIETELPPDELIKILLQIEKQQGRVRKQTTVGYSDRIIDLDILVWSGGDYHSENLDIPHKQLEKRRFALVPLVEIAPELPIGKLAKNASTLLMECIDDGEVHQIVS